MSKTDRLRRLKRLEALQAMLTPPPDQPDRYEEVRQAYQRQYRTRFSEAEWAMIVHFREWFPRTFGQEPENRFARSAREMFGHRSGKPPEFKRNSGNGTPRTDKVAIREATDWIETHHPEIDVGLMHKYMEIVYAFETRIVAEAIYGEVPEKERRYFLDGGVWAAIKFRIDGDEIEYRYTLRIIVAPQGEQLKEALIFSREWKRRKCVFEEVEEDISTSLTPLQWVRGHELLKKADRSG